MLKIWGEEEEEMNGSDRSELGGMAGENKKREKKFPRRLLRLYSFFTSSSSTTTTTTSASFATSFAARARLSCRFCRFLDR